MAFAHCVFLMMDYTNDTFFLVFVALRFDVFVQESEDIVLPLRNNKIQKVGARRPPFDQQADRFSRRMICADGEVHRPTLDSVPFNRSRLTSMDRSRCLAHRSSEPFAQFRRTPP